MSIRSIIAKFRKNRIVDVTPTETKEIPPLTEETSVIHESHDLLRTHVGPVVNIHELDSPNFIDRPALVIFCSMRDLDSSYKSEIPKEHVILVFTADKETQKRILASFVTKIRTIRDTIPLLFWGKEAETWFNTIAEEIRREYNLEEYTQAEVTTEDKHGRWMFLHDHKRQEYGWGDRSPFFNFVACKFFANDVYFEDLNNKLRD